MKRKWMTAAASWMLLPCLTLCLLPALRQMESGRSEEEARQVEQAVRRAAVACCAAEGAYPPNLGYLQEHYGLQINEERYVVYYEVFASNLMPDITVLRNGG